MPIKPASSNGTALSGPTGGVAAALRLPVWSYVLGLAAILVALGASGGLAYQHLSGHLLPGCGGDVIAANMGASLGGPKHESACATLEVHPMGSLGGMWVMVKGFAKHVVVDKIAQPDAIWPVSFLGATYFAAALAAWVVIGWRGRRLPAIIPWVARLGALTSVVYIIVILVSNKLCPYCITSHIGNLTLWLALEIGIMHVRSRSLGKLAMDRAWSSVVAAVAIFALTSGVLGAFEASHREEQRAKDRIEKTRMEEDFKARMSQATQPATEKAPWGPPLGFRGRWLLGPKESVVRVVMLTDFQCPDCLAFETQLMNVYNANPGKMSISIVHFPMCTECNTFVSKTMHVNACKAARAAEAAAMIAGAQAAMDGKDQQVAANEMFFKMAEWLFSVKGQFEEADFRAKLPALGITNVDAVIKAWQGDATLKIVRDECKWGEILGLFFTPMMFVNGVEVRGWLTNPMALTESINTVIKLNPPPADARDDNPPLMGQKMLLDWKLSPRMEIPAAQNPAYIKSGPNPKVDVVVWGDLTEPGTKELDGMIQTLLATKAIRYSFRHYPVCADCNPGVPSQYPMGCIAANALEAAGIVGGPDAYFKMKDLIFSRQGSISEKMLGLAAGSLGLDAAKFQAAAADKGPGAVAVQNDVMPAKRYVTRFIPTIFVDGKYVERWKRDGDNVLERIIDDAVANPGK